MARPSFISFSRPFLSIVDAIFPRWCWDKNQPAHLATQMIGAWLADCRGTLEAPDRATRSLQEEDRGHAGSIWRSKKGLRFGPPPDGQYFEIDSGNAGGAGGPRFCWQPMV